MILSCRGIRCKVDKVKVNVKKTHVKKHLNLERHKSYCVARVCFPID